MNQERDVTGKFGKASIKKNKRSNFFKWSNELKQKDPEVVGVFNDHSNYFHNHTDIAAEAEFTDPLYGKQQSWGLGRRIVELDLLAVGMYCCICKSPLHLSNTVGEKLFGLSGIIMIRCDLCATVTDVQTGKRGPTGSYDINTKAALGMIHAGIGPTHLQNVLAECNLPSISENTLRKKEKELSKQIGEVANTSCRTAQEEEKAQSTNNNVEASFDGGWQKRGSGWNYNSNTGHSTFIGKESGKVLSFELRSKACKTCEYHQSRKETVPDHDCHLNWHGSSKAMEADMAVTMAHRLKDDGCEIKVVHADNDASTTARLQVEFDNISKKDDQNHVKKGISTSLHNISKSYRELQKDETRQYILRCFMYAIKGGETEDDIKCNLERIVPHVFGSHEKCEDVDWCTYNTNPENFKYKSLPNGKPLTSDGLKEELHSLVRKMISRSESITDLGSTQANESFNQLVSVKAPKARHYGGSCSLQNRLSAAVLQKNEGYGYLSKVNEAASLSPGELTMSIASARDKKKEKRKIKKQSKEFKITRIQKKRKRNINSRKDLVKEGKTYENQLELSIQEDPDQGVDIPPPLKIDRTESYVFFDLETTGLGRKSDITQIAALTNGKKFQRYVIPRVEINIEASKVTGITYSHSTNTMYVRGQKVEPVTLQKALLDFISFIKEFNNPILIGHNICNFDIPIISEKLKECKLFTSFSTIVKGFIDTLKVAKKYVSNSDIPNFKQETLVKHFLGETYLAHNAIEDVKSLHSLYEMKLAHHIKSDDLYAFVYHKCLDSYSDILKSKAVSRLICVRLAKDGISLKHLKLAASRDSNGIKFVFEDHKVPQKSVKAFSEYLKDEE
ncbi:Hypothetical predicted protein [Mytilus galloprovincialis]|uniref:Exonuclease domain-containing protein n=1 Tax=Mytilus galloprovincialis TaxID=29158 RepID=A0A8B6E6D3_MYTGA|nr:Hypothetical predicted protein [Mytilus galloprovincialis]